MSAVVPLVAALRTTHFWTHQIKLKVLVFSSFLYFVHLNILLKTPTVIDCLQMILAASERLHTCKHDGLFIIFLSQSSCTGYTPTGIFTHLPHIQTDALLNLPLWSERPGHCFSLLVGGQTLLWARGSPRPNRAPSSRTVLWLLAEIRWQTRHDAKAKAG